MSGLGFLTDGVGQPAPGFDRITFEAGKMGGRACIRGLRITVSQIVSLLAGGATTEHLLRDFPDLEAEDIQQACEQAVHK